MSLLLSSLTKLTNFDVRGYSLDALKNTTLGLASHYQRQRAHNALHACFFICADPPYPFNDGLGGGIERCAGLFDAGKANPVQFITKQISLCGDAPLKSKMES